MLSFGVFAVFDRISMKAGFGGDVFNLWVGFPGLPSEWQIVGGRRCWDLCFLDAQTGSMNNMKVAIKVGS